MKRQRRPISSNTLAVSKRHHHRAHTSLMQGSVGLTRLFQLDHRWTRRFVASVAVFSMVGLGAAPALADAESPDTPPAVSAEVSEPAGVEQAPEPPSAESSPAAPAPAPAPEAVPATAPPAAPVDPPAAPPAEVPADPPAQSAASTAPAPRAMSDDSDPQPPYLRWLVVDSDGLAPVANTEIAVRKSDTLTATIADNVGQLDYSGADLDTRPGWFTVKTLADDADTSVTHDITLLDELKVRPVQAPAGFAVGDDAGWANFTSTDDVVHDDAVQRLALTPPTSTVEEPDDLAQDAADDESTGGGIGILAVGGPEPGINAPFLYWNVANSGGDPVAGATFQLQGPRTGGGNWGTVRTVTDCVEAPCDGLDLDPDPGEFQVPHLNPGSGNGTPVEANRNYRIQPTMTPSDDWSYVGASNTNTPTWNNQAGAQTHNIGTIVLAEPSPVNIVVRARVLANPTAVTSNPVLANSGIGTNYAHTAGTTFRLYENTNNAQGAPTAFTCTIASGGECTITVTGAGNFGKRFWVVEETPAPGTYVNPYLYTGDYTLPDAVRYLVGLTKEITTSSPTLYMPMTSNNASDSTQLATGDLSGVTNGTTSVAQAASFGAMANSLMNPAIAPQCEVDPLRVALVLDQSASITPSQWTTFRNALVDGSDSTLGLLHDADALVSILGFGSNVTSAGDNSWRHGASAPALLPSNYANLIPPGRPGGASNATNWDAAFSTIQNVNPTHQFDLVLFVTDGAPNYILDGTGPDGTNVSVRSVEAPIYAANAIKAAGTRLVALGVREGNVGLLGGAPNLRAISGVTPGSDYIESDWDRVQTILTDVVKAATCTLPIEVAKTTVSTTGATVTTAGGWEFTANHTGEGTTLSSPATQTTSSGLAGTAEWDLAFTEPNGQTASLTLTETVQAGWTLTDVVCTVAGIEVDVTIDSNSSVTIPGLTPTSEKVFCTFTNTETPPDATVQLNKTWVITNQEGDTIDTFYLRGEDDPAPYEWLTATPSLAPTPAPGPEPEPGGLEWGKPYAGYSENDEVTIGESASLATTAPPGCLITVSQLTSVNGTTTTIDPTSSDGDSLTFPAQTLDIDDNIFGITNTVTCTSMLTLTKTLSPEQLIASSGATPGDWMLTAAAADEATHTGAGTWTQPVTAATSYTLTEALATTPSADASLYVPRADGAWSCALAGDGALADSEWSEFGSVTVPLGQHVECAVENVTAQLTLLKFVDGGSAEPNTWNLHAEVTDEDLAERPPVAGSWSGTSDASGTGQAVTANTVLVKPGTNYALSESFAETTTNLAYLLDRVERWDDATSEWVSADPSTVAVEAGDHAIYRFVNEPAPAVNIPLTGGMSAALFSTWGTALIVLAALLTAAYIDRTRRQGGAR